LRRQKGTGLKTRHYKGHDFPAAARNLRYRASTNQAGTRRQQTREERIDGEIAENAENAEKKKQIPHRRSPKLGDRVRDDTSRGGGARAGRRNRQGSAGLKPGLHTGGQGGGRGREALVEGREGVGGSAEGIRTRNRGAWTFPDSDPRLIPDVAREDSHRVTICQYKYKGKRDECEGRSARSAGAFAGRGVPSRCLRQQARAQQCCAPTGKRFNVGVPSDADDDGGRGLQTVRSGNSAR